MHSDRTVTMAASTSNSSRSSSARDSVSTASSSSSSSAIMQPPIIRNVLPSASTIRSSSNVMLNAANHRNHNIASTSMINMHDCGETVTVIPHHHHHHQLHHTNGLSLSNDQIRPDDMLVDSSSVGLSHQSTVVMTLNSAKGMLLDSPTSETSQCSISVMDDCLPSTTLSHQSLIMHTSSESVIPTSPIATLTLESASPVGCQGLGIINNNSKKSNNNIFFHSGESGTDDDDLILDRVAQATTASSVVCDNFSASVASSSVQSSCSTSAAATAASSSSSTTAATTTRLTHSGNGSSSSADKMSLNVNTDSLSSESGDIDIKDLPIEENEGYQDNTSSNSQQSAGGSVSGGGGNGGVISGNGSGGYISLIPPPVGTTGTTTQCGEQIDFKHLFEELCPVCGDKVSGYHYGLLTCESCKGFFKRTVQNKKVYTCVAERSCHIDKTQRKRCPYCRFQKCLEVGMKLEAVRADRMRGGRNKFGPMYKRDRARKLQMMRQRQLALQAIRGSMGSTEIKTGQLSPTGYQQSYPSMNIKQEIQIPQVSSLTQSPDSSPSPIAIALGQVNPSTAVIATSLSGSSGSGTNTTTVSGAGGGGSGTCGHSSDTVSGASLQHTSDSKLCFDTGTNPSSTADSVSNVEPLRVSPMIREFVQSIDDREWQTQLFTLLQKQSYNQVEVDLFELMCKVLDQNLFSQVDWARNTVFFKDLKVDDQMKLLQHSWSDMLVLDHLHQRIHNGLPDETPLNNGQIFNLLGLGLLGVPQLGDYFNELQNKLQELKFDMGDYVCMKFLILLNPNVRGIINKKTVLEGHENVQAALLDYTLTCYPSVTDKFSRLLSILPEIHAMAARGEEHLYLKHCAGSAPTQTLLMEMLHAKRKV